jgi:hypothetical protein
MQQMLSWRVLSSVRLLQTSRFSFPPSSSTLSIKAVPSHDFISWITPVYIHFWVIFGLVSSRLSRRKTSILNSPNTWLIWDVMLIWLLIVWELATRHIQRYIACLHHQLQYMLNWLYFRANILTQYQYISTFHLQDSHLHHSSDLPDGFWAYVRILRLAKGCGAFSAIHWQNSETASALKPSHPLVS